MQRALSSAIVLTAVVGCTDPPTESPTKHPRTITARDGLTLRGADGASVEVPTDLDAAVIQAYARAEDGTWSTFAGEGTPDGELVVPNVPAGGAWLRIDYFDASPEPRVRNEYFWLEGDEDVELDLRTWRFGRRIEHATSVPTLVDLKLRALEPWRPERDIAVIYEPNSHFVQAFHEDGNGISGMPGLQETEADVQVDWAGALGAPLIDAARGDRAYALQLRFVNQGPLRLGAAIRSSVVPAFSVADGQTAAVETTFTRPDPLLVQIAMDTNAFDALRPAISNNASAAIGRGFSILSSPSAVTEEFSPTSLPAELLVVDNDFSAEPSFDAGGHSISSPFPRESVFGHFAAAYAVEMERDDGLTGFAQAEIGVMTDALPTETAPAAPLLGPVRDLKIGGHPAFEGPQGVGLTPELTWAAPALGTPTEYEVTILAPGGADPRYDFLWYPAAVFHVPGAQTALALPPEILVDGYPHAIAIRAISNALPAEQRAIAPRHQALPYAWADTITPAFKP
jgi:hypothetical protein